MKKLFTVATVVVSATLLTTSIVYAATTRNITSRLGGKAGDIFDLDGALFLDSLKVGAQGVGGVTYFNGTIINNTTGSGGANNPVTFGDNVRIDGTLYRGATAGPGDQYPLKLNDDVIIYGDVTFAKTNATITGLSSDNLSDASTLAKGDKPVIITADWLNTAYPWSADEIADITRRVNLPLSAFYTDADGTPATITAATVPNLAYTANQGLALVYSAEETTDIGTQMTIPNDFAGNGVFKALVDTSGSIVTAANLDFKVAISQTSGTPAWDTDMDDETAVAITSSPGRPQIITFTPTDQTDMEPGGTIFFDLFPSGYAAGEPDIEIYAIWFEYTATQ